LPLVQ